MGQEWLARSVLVEETPMASFTGLKVFSTTLARDREAMGENITRWLRENPQVEVVDKIVTQSSDKEFHCLTITLFYREKEKRP
jgi:hypothetical protein